MKLINYCEGAYNSHADPYILKAEDGRFYVYVTGVSGVHAYVSETLTGDYRYIGKVFSVAGKKEYWAPAVSYIDGKYYMYVSFMNEDSEDVHEEAIHVAVSDTPEGPFGDVKPLLDPFSIDAHVVENASGLYIFYSVNDYEAERAGTYIVVDKMKSPTEVTGAPVSVLRPSIDEEIFMKDRFREGQHWHTLEGAFYFFHRGYHYLMYSGNCYQNEYYFLGCASSADSTDDLTRVKFSKQPSECEYAPVIAKNEFEAGTGHNSVIEVDGELYCIYHGRDIPPDLRLLGDSRTARICKLRAECGALRAVRYEDKI